MPRMSREQTALHREKIIQVAARLFREHGLNGIGVADLMAGAGMTHGGFYGHFESKNALSAQACARSFEQTAEYWNDRIAQRDGGTDTAQAFIQAYLSPEHRANPGSGCVVPALAAEVAREPADSPVRHAFTSGIGRMIEMLSAMLPAARAARRRREQALMMMAALVGAVAIARATQGNAMSDEILDAVQNNLLELASD